MGAIHRAGVPLLAGTDAGWVQPYVYAGFSLHDELALLVRAGLTPMESLQTATINPARFLGMEKDLGTIEKGKVANLVLLNADPLADIHNTTKISEVFLAGKEFDRACAGPDVEERGSRREVGCDQLTNVASPTFP